MKPRPLARLGLEMQFAVVVFDDPAADRQTYACPFVARLGAEKRIENPLPNLLRDARTVVLDGKAEAGW